jgi:transposase
MDYFSSSLNGSTVASLLEHICSLRVGKAVVAMVLLQEVVSKRSMNFANQRKAYVLRTVGKKSWTHIAGQVVNLQGNRPAWGSVRNVVTAFSVKRGRRHYKYARCGRKPWKMTPDVQQYVLRRLLADRTSKVVTSKTLQADVAREKGVLVADSCIRKLLLKRGYKWLPRRQKRKYSAAEKRVRLGFARAALRLGERGLLGKLSMSLDGVILSMPPSRDVDRFNYCWAGSTYMWRKPSEANKPALAGDESYGKQVPIQRCIPLWGVSHHTAAPQCCGMPRKRPTLTNGVRLCLTVGLCALFGPSIQKGAAGRTQCSATTRNSCEHGRAWQRMRAWAWSSGAFPRVLQT